MAWGAGIYDAECTEAREKTKADAVILMVVKGDRGSGFSMQTADTAFLLTVPELLRSMADQIEKSIGGAWPKP